jgi:hypothetical protein
MSAMKTFVITLIILPWVVGIAAAIRVAGREILFGSSGDIRSQADRMRAFGAS